VGARNIVYRYLLLGNEREQVGILVDKRVQLGQLNLHLEQEDLKLALRMDPLVQDDRSVTRSTLIA
jgi:hypothetical protein